MPTFHKLVLASLAIIFIAALLFIRACKQMPPPSPPSVLPTATAPPSHTPTPSPTVTPTSPPTPTFTPTPLADEQLSRTLTNALWLRDDKRAERVLKHALQTSPSPYLQFLLARVLLREQHPNEAIPLLQALKPEAGRSVPPEVYLVLAHALQDIGQPADALNAYRAYVRLTPSPRLADLAYHEMARLQQEWGDGATADRAYRQAIARAQGDEQYKWTWERARALAEHLRIEDALTTYTSLLKEDVPAIWRAQAYLDRGRMYLLLGHPKEAYRDLRACVELAVETQGGSRPAHVHPELIPYAHRALIILVEADQRVDDYTRGVVDVEAGAYGPAYKALINYLRHTSTPHKDARAYLARAYTGLGQMQQAIQEWQTIIRTSPECPCWDTAWFQLATLYRQSGHPERALQVLRELTHHPKASPRLKARAQLTIADRWLLMGNLENARTEYARLAYEWPGTREGTRAALVASVLYLPDHPQNAITLLERSLTSSPHPVWEYALRYWLGIAYAEGGQTEAAREQWTYLAARRPNSVYAFRAAERLDALGEPVPPWHPPRGQSEHLDLSILMPPDERIAHWRRQVNVSKDVIATLQRAAACESAGMETESIRTYAAAISHLQDERALLTLGRILLNSGYPQLGIQAALRAMGIRGYTLAEVPATYWPLLFPTPARDHITDVAGAFDLDPALIYAIIRQESHFATTATSTVNARGLMQLMPETALEVARGLGISIQREEELYRPLLNLRLGTYYFAFVFHRFEGNRTAALAAYNAGPGNVDRWLSFYGEDRDRFTELIPLLETRTYVREVERQWWIYQALLESF